VRVTRPRGAIRKYTVDNGNPDCEYPHLNMRFIEDSITGQNTIRGYESGVIRINAAEFRGPVLVSASAIAPGPAIRAIEELGPAHAAPILALEPELVLLGTGVRQSFPRNSFGAEFLRLAVGFEVMDTGAAARTFNVLVAEQRRVVALLFP